MTSILNADLHCHSVVSDGTLTPEALAERAAANGVELWSLTDHDEIGGQHRAAAAARAHGLKYLTGTEISSPSPARRSTSSAWASTPTTPRSAGASTTPAAGAASARQEMAEGLAKVGIHGAYEGALRFVGNPELISRTHFARFLVEAGHCRDTSEVFRKFLTEGKPGYVPHRWATLKDAVQWITAAKGMAVIAHPGRYKFTANEEYALFIEFKAHGGQAIEVVTGSHTPAEYVEYADKALEFDFAASRGSDFHSPDESHCDLGQLPPLPGKLTPVWELLADRIQ